MKKWKKGPALLRGILYSAVFLAAAAIFFLAAFPGDKVAALLNARLEAAGWKGLTVASASWRFPLSLFLEGVGLTAGSRSVYLGDAVVSPALSGFGRGRTAWSVRLDFPGGTVPARVSTGPGGRWEVRLEARGLVLGEIPALKDLMPLDVKGDLDLTGEAFGQATGTGTLNGKGRMEAREVILEGDLLQGFGLQPLSLTLIRSDWTLEGDRLVLAGGKVEGDLMGTLGGEVVLVPGAVSRSALDLSLSLRPSREARDRLAPVLGLLGAGDGGELQFRIRGTLAEPSIAL